ncbi:MAG TPA: hypothetical protein VN699_03455 [Pirellulales bacterium]|nr:hypothetical protein [Pirellulales bacterium]
MSILLPTRKVFESVALHASAAETASGTSAAVKLPIEFRAVAFEFDLTAAAAAAGDTLDVVIQTKSDQSNWLDVVHFTQALGNGGAKRYVAAISAGVNQAVVETIGTALTAGNVRNIWGDEWRASWTIVNSSNPSFTFSVWACTQ